MKYLTAERVMKTACSRAAIWQTAARLLLVAALMATATAKAGDKLTILDGLEVWFDACQIAAASPGATTGSDEEHARVKSWPDASGNERHAQQNETAAQPQLIQVRSATVVRFDGVDDHLRVTGNNRTIRAATVFVVAAPQKNAGSFRAFVAANAPQQSDFVSGFTIDQGVGATLAFNHLNVE